MRNFRVPPRRKSELGSCCILLSAESVQDCLTLGDRTNRLYRTETSVRCITLPRYKLARIQSTVPSYVLNVRNVDGSFSFYIWTEYGMWAVASLVTDGLSTECGR
jgi:hypothetical protein